MDPISVAVGLAIAAGAIFVDVRGASLVRERIERQIEEQAKLTTIVVDQPTEKYIIDFESTR